MRQRAAALIHRHGVLILALWLVTHDRRMLESASVTRRLVVSAGQVTEADL